MTIEYKPKERRSLCEVIRVPLGDKVYEISYVSASMMNELMKFQDNLDRKDREIRSELKRLDMDYEDELRRARDDRRARMKASGVPDADIEAALANLRLANPDMEDMARFVGSFIGEDPAALLKLPYLELTDLSEFLMEHLGKFMDYDGGAPVVKNS